MKRNTGPGRALLLLLCSLPLWLQACTAAGRRHDGPEAVLASAVELHRRGGHQKAEERLTELIRSREARGNDTLIARAYRCRAECRMGEGRLGLARFDLDHAMRVAEGTPSFEGNREGFLVECAMEKGDTYMLEEAFLKADGIYTELLDARPPQPYKDRLLFRRYLCGVKLYTPNPDRFLMEIEDQSHFDEGMLRRRFLGGESRPPLAVPEAKGLPGLLPAPDPGTVKILPRAAWGARPTRSNVSPMTRITRITVHHTGEVWEETDRETTAARIRVYQKVHQDKHWADLGYHFLIDRAGRIWEGRPLRYQGAHAGNNALNRGNIGIAVMGNYDEEWLTAAQQESLVNLLTVLCRNYGLAPATAIVTHREIRPQATACPGRRLQAFVEEFRRVNR